MNKCMVEAAHDMKMPLQLICSCAQMLETEFTPGTNADLYLKMLVESAQDLKNMVLAALDGDDYTYESVYWENRDIVEEMRRVVRHFSLTAREKGVLISFSANTRSFLMQTDAMKLRRMMENLVGNALKATPSGGRIELSVAVRGDAVDLTVSDNGCGIREKDFERIFRMGYTTGGSGIGLSIVEKYAHVLGGCVYASSEENVGSCFTVHLPVKCEKISV